MEKVRPTASVEDASPDADTLHTETGAGATPIAAALGRMMSVFSESRTRFPSSDSPASKAIGDTSITTASDMSEWIEMKVYARLRLRDLVPGL